MGKKICICGLGYIGLPLAGILSTKGYDVVGFDVKESTVKAVNSGKIQINEPDLDLLISAGLNSNKLVAKDKPEKSDVFIIAVPTPVNDDKTVDLSYVESAGESIYPFLEKGNLIILESTVPPGTTVEVLKPILEKSGLKAGKDLLLVHCPERVLPGSILYELVENDRMIGGVNEESILQAKEIYGSFVKGMMYSCDATTAEFVKLIENTFRDVNIALANELSIISKGLGIDVWNAIDLANKHPRVNIHKPGPGVGGHCIPVDPYFIIEKDPKHAKLMSMARNINDGMAKYVAGVVKDKLKGKTNPKITIYGVAYKPNVDDARETPSTHVIENLKCFNLVIHDPFVQEYNHELVRDIYEAAKGSDCLVFLTGHKHYKYIDLKKMSETMKGKVVLDTVNILDVNEWKNFGFDVWKL